MTERIISFYEYIAEAMRYAQENVGEQVDFSNSIILLPKHTSDGRDKILGLPVYIVDSLSSDFDIAFPYDSDSAKEKALVYIREYKELYPTKIPPFRVELVH
jgi:hypothetical protein